MNLGPWEILIIAGVVVMLFGAKKMPQMARSLGQSMRILKAETKGMREDASTGTAANTTDPAGPPAEIADHRQDGTRVGEGSGARETAR